MYSDNKNNAKTLRRIIGQAGGHQIYFTYSTKVADLMQYGFWKKYRNTHSDIIIPQFTASGSPTVHFFSSPSFRHLLCMNKAPVLG